jgi:antitoxin component YwqK of YwqJK toxin-antitoxin module
MKKLLLTAIYLSLAIFLDAQENIDLNGYNRFYYENGNLSSEGYMKDGKPDGYWRTYFESGNLKSEGNRRNFLLDSIWNFYSDSGKVVLKITYVEGKKNGIRTTYEDDEIIEENFEDDVKQGLTYYYYPNGKPWKEINFIDGLEEGTGKEFSAFDGRVIKLITYKKGYTVYIEHINKIDRANMKQGKWKFFYPNGNVSLEGEYKNDLKHGYFKEFSENGDLLMTSKYIDGILQEDVAELAKLDIKTEYYPNGKPKIVASFKNDVPEGVRREYSPEGKIVAGYVFKNGNLSGEGITNEAGTRDGLWKEYYPNGALRSTGIYNQGRRVGEWKFYHPNGQIEQTGSYNRDGKEEGTWMWYFPTGNILREEKYRNGKIDGLSTEYDETGAITAQGEYIDDHREGKWKFNYGDHIAEEEYLNGMLNGSCKNYYSDGIISFEGKFIEDTPNGHHTWFYPNGNKKTEGDYVMGLKSGEWLKYNNDGTLFLSIFYENGVERKYDGVRVRIYEENMADSSEEKESE